MSALNVKMAKANGFSLVELSIVLIVLGLLVTGVISGGALIRAAKVRAIANEIEGFNNIVNTFRLTYDALPGDMSNINSAPELSASTPGNGDSFIDFCNITDTFNANGNSSNNESLGAWVMLNQANLIPGTYNHSIACAGALTDSTAINVTMPGTRVLSSVAYAFGKYNTGTASAVIYNNTVVLGGPITGNKMPGSPLLPYDLAKEIDRKMDDGSGLTGSVIAYSDSVGALSTVVEYSTVPVALRFVLSL